MIKSATLLTLIQSLFLACASGQLLLHPPAELPLLESIRNNYHSGNPALPPLARSDISFNAHNYHSVRDLYRLSLSADRRINDGLLRLNINSTGFPGFRMNSFGLGYALRTGENLCFGAEAILTQLGQQVELKKYVPSLSIGILYKYSSTGKAGAFVRLPSGFFKPGMLNGVAPTITIQHQYFWNPRILLSTELDYEGGQGIIPSMILFFGESNRIILNYGVGLNPAYQEAGLSFRFSSIVLSIRIFHTMGTGFSPETNLSWSDWQ